MDMLIPLLFIVVLAVIYAAMFKEGVHRVTIVLGALAIVLAFCFYQTGSMTSLRQRIGLKEGFTGAPVDYALGRCGGFNYGKLSNNVMPLTGNFDGLRLKNGAKPDYSLLSQDKVAYHSPVGDAYALNPDPSASAGYPTVDGTPNTPHHMFMFAYNRSSPECCPSTFSSDRGCVCMSNAQRDFINRRGNQKSYNENPDF